MNMNVLAQVFENSGWGRMSHDDSGNIVSWQVLLNNVRNRAE